MYMKIRYSDLKTQSSGQYVMPNFFYDQFYEVEELFEDNVSIITDVDNYYHEVNFDWKNQDTEKCIKEYQRITDLYTKDIKVRYVKIKGLIRPEVFLVSTNKEIRKKYKIKKFIFKSNPQQVQEYFDWVVFNRELQINNLLK